MNKHRMMVLVCAVLLACGLSGFGQTKTDLTGQVIDDKGAVVPGATVTAVASDGTTFNRATNDNGEFVFPGLTPGVYTIKTQWYGPLVSKSVSLLAGQNNRISLAIRLNPCSGLEGDKNYRFTESDRAEIVRQLVTFITDGNVVGGVRPNAGEAVAEFLLVPDNLQASWLTSEQQKRVKLMTRSELQAFTEKLGDLNYFRIYPLKQHGACVEAVVTVNVTVKGQAEDANMSGGTDIYEFVKAPSGWVGTWFRGSIS